MRDNPVSRKIVNNSAWNQLGEYLPVLWVQKSGLSRSYSITARLPKEPHEKWLPYINGNLFFREKIKNHIESILSGHTFRGQSFLEIRFGFGSTSFETDGINGCMVYVGDGINYGYSYHNIDNFEQAAILFIALSIYLSKLYFALETFESGKVNLKKSPRLEKVTTFRISLNQVKGCTMGSNECLHWASWYCFHCIRNWEKLIPKSEAELQRLGDKYEPLEGSSRKFLCVSCAANLKKAAICHYCGTDNSEWFPELNSKLRYFPDDKQKKLSDFF